MLGLTVAFTLSIGAMSAAIVHLIPYLTDHGWTDLHAAIAAGLIGATQVAARVVFGLFAERVAAARLALSCSSSPSAASCCSPRRTARRPRGWPSRCSASGRAPPRCCGHSCCPGGSTRSSTAAAPPRAQRGAPSPEPSPRCCSPAPPASAPRATRSGSPCSPSIGIAGAVVAYRSLLIPPPALVPVFADTTR